MKRRRFLLASSGIAGLAGCSGIGSDSTPTGSSSPTPTDSATPSSTSSPTDATDTPESDSPTETEDEGPGYKANHWHGRLFFEVNGELVNFRQDKYYLKNIEDENPDAVYFHFHEDPENHGPNEWSNEKKIVTFAEALNLLPGIGYEQTNGNHAVTYEGTTFDGGNSGTTVNIHRGTERIDPTTYEVKHNDNYWVQVSDQNTKRNVSPSHSGAELGTLVFDINNVRVDFSTEKYTSDDAGSDAFHFHDDGHPNLFYLEGSTTLADALNSLPDIAYEQSDGNHVVEFHSDTDSEYSRRYDGGAPQHEITIQQRATAIDPTSYELSGGDIVWMYVHSTVVPDNEH